MARARDVLSRQLLNLSDLIETLLEYSRLSVNRRSQKPRLGDMKSIVTDAAEAVEATASERRQRMRVEAGSGPTHPTAGGPVQRRDIAARADLVYATQERATDQ